MLHSLQKVTNKEQYVKLLYNESRSLQKNAGEKYDKTSRSHITLYKSTPCIVTEAQRRRKAIIHVLYILMLVKK